MEMAEHASISVRIERHGRCVLHAGGNAAGGKAAVNACWRQGRCECWRRGRCECMLAARPL